MHFDCFSYILIRDPFSSCVLDKVACNYIHTSDPLVLHSTPPVRLKVSFNKSE